jgi:hypothetical protein
MFGLQDKYSIVLYLMSVIILAIALFIYSNNNNSVENQIQNELIEWDQKKITFNIKEFDQSLNFLDLDNRLPNSDNYKYLVMHTLRVLDCTLCELDVKYLIEEIKSKNPSMTQLVWCLDEATPEAIHIIRSLDFDVPTIIGFDNTIYSQLLTHDNREFERQILIIKTQSNQIIGRYKVPYNLLTKNSSTINQILKTINQTIGEIYEIQDE